MLPRSPALSVPEGHTCRPCCSRPRCLVHSTANQLAWVPGVASESPAKALHPHRRISRVCLSSHQHDITPQATTAVQPEVDWSKYRRAVGLCVINHEGLVFAATRSDSGCSTWQMPQGGIDPGEEPEQAVLRELREETSMTSVTILSSIDHWLTYDHPPQVKARLPPGWEHLKGQAQKWFLLRFDGDESEINLDTPDKEFSRWTWLPLHQLPDAVVPFKRGVYEEVVRTFAPRIQQLVDSTQNSTSSLQGTAGSSSNGNGKHHSI